MAQTKISAEVVSALSRSLQQNHDDIQAVKASMDNQLNSFIWDDPVGRQFIARYYEDLKPIENRLVPDLVAYCNFLDQLIQRTTEFNSELL